MTTLEMMIAELYDEKGYLYTDDEIKSAAEYIEVYNQGKDEDELCLTPIKWFYETQLNYPEEFVTKDQVCSKIARYFVEQRKLCIDQTGCLPCYEDWAQEMESDEFKDTIGERAEAVTITEFLNWLLDTADDVLHDWC